MAKQKPKRDKAYNPKRAEQILLRAHHNAVLKEAAKPLKYDLAEKYCNLLSVHAHKMVLGNGTSVSLDILCFFSILSRNLAQLANFKTNVGNCALDAIQGAAETAYYKKITEMDLSTGQKKALLELNRVCEMQIKSAATYHFSDAYKHAQRCVVDMNRKSGIVASFGEMPELGQPFLTYEEFKLLISQAKESIESETNLRYKINLYSLEYDEEATQKEQEKMALDQRLFVTGQLLENEPIPELEKKKMAREAKSPRPYTKRESNLCTDRARERCTTALELLPLLFTCRTADELIGEIYTSGAGFIYAANQQKMLTPTGVKIGQAMQYANPLHDGYPAWLEQHEAKNKPKRAIKLESRA